MTILDEIIASKFEGLKAIKSRDDYAAILDDLKEKAAVVTLRRDFKGALILPGINIIAEVKKASPSKGVIRHDFDPLKIARDYEKHGASAISVLTDEKYFQGRLEYVPLVRNAVDLPVLRKDFIVDEYQIYESAAIGADALLLIVAALKDDKLKELLELTNSLGMSALVEVHTEDEANRALNVGAEIIGINNRDLKTFKTDLETTRAIARILPDDVVVVSESGIKSNADILSLKECGVSAFLVGEALTREANIGAKLKDLLGVKAPECCGVSDG